MENKLTVPISTRIDKWKSFRAGELRTCPPNGLPVWHDLPLDHKLPVFPTPSDEAIFSRGMPAEELNSYEAIKNFRLDDMYGHVMKFPYDPIHDRHLWQHLRKPTVRSCLKRAKMLHENGMALCKLKELNDYRLLTREMNRAIMNEEFKKEIQEEDERREFSRLQQVQEWRYKKFAWQQRLKDLSADRIEKRRLAVELKHIRWLQNLHSIQSKIEANEEFKKLVQVKRILEGEQRRQRALMNLAKLEEKAKTKHLGLIKFLKEKSSGHAKQVRLVKRTLEEDKTQKAIDRWAAKLVANEKATFDRKTLMSTLQEDRQERIEQRKEQMELIHKKQQESFDKRQQQIIEKKYLEKLEKSKNEVCKTVTELWVNEIGKISNISDEKFRIRKCINIAFSEKRSRNSECDYSYLALVDAKERWEDERKIPVQVSYAIEVIIERSITLFAEEVLLEQFEMLIKSATDFGCSLLDEKRKKKGKNAKTKELTDKTKKSVTYGQRYSGFSGESMNDNFLRRISTSFLSGKEVSAESEKVPATKIQQDKIQEKRTSNEQRQTKQYGTFGDRNKRIFSILSGSDTSSSKRRTRSRTLVQFEDVEESTQDKSRFHGMEKEDRRDTMAPSYELLAELALQEGKLRGSSYYETDVAFIRSKPFLRPLCLKMAYQLGREIRKIVQDCMNPVEKYKTMKALSKIADETTTEIAESVADIILYESDKAKSRERTTNAAYKLAKIVILALLEPEELTKPRSMKPEIYNIMFMSPEVREATERNRMKYGKS